MTCRIPIMQHSNISWAIFTGKHLKTVITHFFFFEPMSSRTYQPPTRRIVQNEAQNSMSIGNLAIVFGPTLFPPTAPNGEDGLAGATIQNKVRLISRSSMRPLKVTFRLLRPFSNITPIYSSTSLKSHELSLLSPIIYKD